jgi:hypothetical protein
MWHAVDMPGLQLGIEVFPPQSQPMLGASSECRVHGTKGIMPL